MSQKPIILGAFANTSSDGGSHLRNLEEERARIQAAIERASDVCDFVPLENAAASTLIDAFQSWRDRVAIFHFGGHSDSYHLLLEDTRHESAKLPGRDLARFLAQQHGLKIVFLNGCSTEGHVDSLVRSGVDVVIATTNSVSDDDALAFATNFYNSLATGASLGRSFREAQIAAELISARRQRLGRRSLRYSNQATVYETRRASTSDRWPWVMKHRPNADGLLDWSLAEAAESPYFGIPELPSQSSVPRPFKYLQSYDESDCHTLFGRGYETRAIYDRLCDKSSAAVLLVHGNTGVGKSSLLHAGVVPRLRDRCAVVFKRREVGLHETLLAALATRDAGPSWPSSHACEEVPAEHRMSGAKPWIVLIDQCEEEFEESAGRTKFQEFATKISQFFATNEKGEAHNKLVLAFRTERLSWVEQGLCRARVPYEKYFVDRLSKRGIQNAIDSLSALDLSPKLTIADGLSSSIASKITEDSRSPYAPILQILLSKMWEATQNEPGPRVTWTRELFRRFEDVHLRSFLEEQLKVINQLFPDQVESGLVLDLLGTLVAPSGDMSLRRSESQLTIEFSHAIDEPLAELLKACFDAHLVGHRQDDSSEEYYRLAHDTLAQPVVNALRLSRSPGQKARRILDEAIQRRDDDPQYSLSYSELVTVERGKKGTRCLTKEEKGLEKNSWAKLKRSRRRVGVVVSFFALTIVALAGTVRWLNSSAQINNAVAALRVEGVRFRHPNGVPPAKSLQMSSPEFRVEVDLAGLRREDVVKNLLALRKFEFLDLRGEIVKDLSFLSEVDVLRHLELSGSGAQPSQSLALDQVVGRSDLTALYLKGMQVNETTFSLLSKNDALRELSLFQCNLLDSEASTISRMKALSILRLSRNPEVTGEYLDFTSEHDLKFLDLSKTSTNDAALQRIGRLKALEKLDLSGTLVSRNAFVHLVNCKKLVTLYLPTTIHSVTPADVELLQKLPNLRLVRFENPSIVFPPEWLPSTIVDIPEDSGPLVVPEL